MADVKNPEVVGAPAITQKGETKKPRKGRAASPIIRIRNMSNDDLLIPGAVIEPGQTMAYPSRVGTAILQSPVVSNYIKLGLVKVI